jgi:hypothetical protein
MTALAYVPALLKVSVAFGLILAAHRLKLHLGIGLFIGAAVLGFLMGLSPWQVAAGMAKSLFLDPMVYALLVIIALILVLSRLMSETGQLDRLVSSFAGVTGNVRLVAAVMPALIGILPMPGGALFSAPMVGAASREANLPPDHLSAINYWFRHIWEYWWPLYPGVILAVSLLALPTWRFILVQAPLTLLAVGVGYFFLLRPIDRRAGRGPASTGEAPPWSEFLKQVFPLILVVLTIPVMAGLEWVTGWSLPGLSPVFIGLGLALVWVIGQNRIPARQISLAVRNPALPQMLLLILGIMVFKGLLIESKAVAQIHEEMTRYGIPPLLVVLFIPFISGFITGIAIGFVGASFPLIVPLLASQGHGLDFQAMAMLGYAAGFMGMMLSPVHLCLLVTQDYFGANLWSTYRRLVRTAASFLVLTAVYFLFLKLL